ncbi:MAG: methionine synthase, partial [Actinobacteria bacterium]|nr:methionine synthase [Actinomycetota bacterium]
AADAFLEMKDAGATAVSFDLGQLPVRETDRVAELAEAGLGLFVGALPTDGPHRTTLQTATEVVGLWRRTGLSPGLLAEQVVVTPACGLAQVSPDAARAALEHCREAARIAAEMVEEISR